MAALECMICTPCGPIRFFSIHLAHIGVGERLEQIDFLLNHHHCSPIEVGPWGGKDDEVHRKWTESETEPECPFADTWMSDFNSEPGSGEYCRITSKPPIMLGPPITKVLLMQRFVRACRRTRFIPMKN